jgi:hypothetical protein
MFNIKQHTPCTHIAQGPCGATTQCTAIAYSPTRQCAQPQRQPQASIVPRLDSQASPQVGQQPAMMFLHTRSRAHNTVRLHTAPAATAHASVTHAVHVRPAQVHTADGHPERWAGHTACMYMCWACMQQQTETHVSLICNHKPRRSQQWHKSLAVLVYTCCSKTVFIFRQNQHSTSCHSSSNSVAAAAACSLQVCTCAGQPM